MGEQSYGEITRVILYDAGLHINISDSENYKPSQNLAQQRLKNHDIKVSRNTDHILKSAAQIKLFGYVVPAARSFHVSTIHVPHLLLKASLAPLYNGLTTEYDTKLDYASAYILAEDRKPFSLMVR